MLTFCGRRATLGVPRGAVRVRQVLRVRGVPTNRFALRLAAFCPVQVLDTSWVVDLATIDRGPAGLDASVTRDNGRVVAGADAYGQVSHAQMYHSAVPVCTKLLIIRNGGECEIRTHGTLRYTRFPSVRLKPLGQLSPLERHRDTCTIRTTSLTLPLNFPPAKPHAGFSTRRTHID